MLLNIGGKLRLFERPAVMGIINVTPDSFYAGSRVNEQDVCLRAADMLDAGADIIDLGGYSTRPGAPEVSEEKELERLESAVVSLRRHFGPDLIISIDTFRAHVAERCIQAGADIINDISGGDLDSEMFDTVARLRVPYILMHTRGKPADMQKLTDYEDVCAEVLANLSAKAARLRQLGVSDIILDPGFGFAKTVDQNYQLMHAIPAFKQTGLPVLVGISRKTMIWKELGITPDEALNGTSALNMLAVLNGADIIRVHDVAEASEVVGIYEAYRRNAPDGERLIEILDQRQPQ